MVEKISAKQMSEYIEKLYSNLEMQKIISNFSTVSQSSKAFCEIGNFATKYYISTMDNSIESAIKIAELYVKSKTKENISFDQEYTDIIIKKVSGKENPTFSDAFKACEIVKKRNVENKFYTHCFPAALRDSVEENGLDISKELTFDKDLALLEKYQHTSYKTGKICYCELSAASLGYATDNLPERVKFALRSYTTNSTEQLSTEDLYAESFKNHVNDLISNGSITSQKEIEDLETAGANIIDFYCKNPNSCISIFQQRDEPNQYKNKAIHSLLEKLKDYIDNKTFFTQQVTQIIDNLSNSQSLEEGYQQFDKEFAEILELCPEHSDALVAMVKEIVTNQMTELSISNYKHRWLCRWIYS